ncbi:hypothetical protein HMPREF1544_02745 [Mucor circinelloides 1006PhL]|uniref:Transcription factor domain-containing protein n=1 Tax=Mucor circinelloides f. circinelloides (strain 1006PhL) TaxID=1220926 RepID=S2JKD8_MUCC1|nr:hypothetical protein HMPREF1544_02745 [Mucor circinelloides 1006PhL]
MSNSYYQQQDAVSPTSTERLLLDYLRPHLEKQQQTQEQLVKQVEEIYPASQCEISLYGRQQSCFSKSVLNDTFMISDEDEQKQFRNANITIELTNFSDLQIALKDIEDLEPTAMRARSNYPQQKTTEEVLVNLPSTTEFFVPPSVRLNIESSQILDMLMSRAVQHWCCIGFKVAPISVDLIKNWRKAPQPIVYCIASICLVTFMDQQIKNNSLYFKQAAMVFYEQARNKLDDILFDDMQPLIIQSYFCLSYTSNLLRLYEQQRTWGGLASISLQHLAEKQVAKSEPLDNETLGCWFRWYYVDAWMCLTLNRDCLLPDKVPWVNMDHIAQLSLAKLQQDQHNLYSFAYLTYYMRRYIRALHSRKIFLNQQLKIPSDYYYSITRELTSWYSHLPKYNLISELHLHLCYNSMRLVVLYQFLNPQQSPPHDIIIDCLETNLELLQALRHLKTLGCDQSTYHHMFFAIHNTAKRILQYDTPLFNAYAEEQLKINLMLLRSTQAYAHDVFKMKMYAQIIQDQFTRMKIAIPQVNTAHSFSASHTGLIGGRDAVFKQTHGINLNQPTAMLPQQPLQTVFKNEQQRQKSTKRKKAQ